MQRPAFTCPRCGTPSWSLCDALAGYCGLCHDFTGTPRPGAWDAFAASCASGSVALAPDLLLQDALNQFPRESAADSAALIRQVPADDPGEDWNPLGYPLDDSARWIPGYSE